MEKKLPINWILIKVVDVSEIVRGITYQKSDASTTKFENSCLVLRGGNIQDGKIVIEDDCVYVPDAIVKKDQKLRKGDVIIVGSTGSAKLIGKAAFSLSDEDEISFGAFLVMLRPDNKIKSRYFDYFFLTEFYRTEIRELAGGININNIRREHLEGIDFPLPPLPEQQHIVAKLNTLFGHLDALKTRLDHIPQLLKDFRKKVLTQAVTGKLTEEWRNGNELQEIDIAFECETDFDLYEIPESWIYSKIGLIGDVKGGKRLPLGDELIADITAHPYIRARDLKQGTVLTDNLMYISEETHKKIQRYIVKKDDVYITIVGAKIGDAGVIPLEMDGANLTENAAKITNYKNIEGEYLSIWLRSPICQDYILKSIMSAAQGKLALTRINELPVYLTVIDEQQEIVRRVESLFAKADQIEASYQKLKTKIEQLPQALLAKAFRGELVEQLPTDGDARELLEEISKAKAGLDKGGRIKKMKVG